MEAISHPAVSTWSSMLLGKNFPLTLYKATAIDKLGNYVDNYDTSQESAVWGAIYKLVGTPLNKRENILERNRGYVATTTVLSVRKQPDMVDKLPGVHLHFIGAELKGAKFKTATVVFHADINDEELWTAVQTRLNEQGVKIYAIDDIKTEMVNAYREEAKRLQGELDKAANENKSMKMELTTLQAALGILRQQAKLG